MVLEMKTPEEKFLDELDKILDANKNFNAEILALLLLGRAASLLAENNLNPAEIIGSVALGADLQVVKEMIAKIEEQESVLAAPVARQDMN